jgi:SNF2 family DNA or RNA helicase
MSNRLLKSRFLGSTDEAQQIKNRNTKAAKAAVALDARLRWCLTG